jgi:hypothetical protein
MGKLSISKGTANKILSFCLDVAFTTLCFSLIDNFLEYLPDSIKPTERFYGIPYGITIEKAEKTFKKKKLEIKSRKQEVTDEGIVTILTILHNFSSHDNPIETLYVETSFIFLNGVFINGIYDFSLAPKKTLFEIKDRHIEINSKISGKKPNHEIDDQQLSWELDNGIIIRMIDLIFINKLTLIYYGSGYIKNKYGENYLKSFPPPDLLTDIYER